MTIRMIDSLSLRPGARSIVGYHAVGRVLLYTLLTAGCVVTLLPFLWMILGAFKVGTEIVAIPPTLWPRNPTLANFKTIFHDPHVPLGHFYLNSLFVTSSVVALNLLSCSLAGFVFAKYEFFGKKTAFGFVLATMMVPFQVLMIPSYLLLAKLGLVDTLWGLIVPAVVGPFGIFMMKQFIEGIPSELMDAGRIDGASEMGVYLRIILPQLGAPMATLGILDFMYYWNDYLWPLIVITSLERRTLPVVLTWYSNQHSQNLALVMAASVLVVIPVLVVYAAFQRWVVEGIAMTGFK